MADDAKTDAKTAPSGKVRAVVVRGSFTVVDSDGNRRRVLPGLGKDSEVLVTPATLEASAGVLAHPDNRAAEEALVQKEAMAPATTGGESTAAPTASGKKK